MTRAIQGLRFQSILNVYPETYNVFKRDENENDVFVAFIRITDGIFSVKCSKRWRYKREISRTNDINEFKTVFEKKIDSYEGYLMAHFGTEIERYEYLNMAATKIRSTLGLKEESYEDFCNSRHTSGIHRSGVSVGES